jgi:hypothetical protein
VITLLEVARKLLGLERFVGYTAAVKARLGACRPAIAQRAASAERQPFIAAAMVRQV